MAARREVTGAMRELAQERAYGYLAAKQLPTRELDELARYHARVAPLQGRNALATARMLQSLVSARTVRTWYVIPTRNPGQRRRTSRGRR